MSKVEILLFMTPKSKCNKAFFRQAAVRRNALPVRLLATVFKM